MSNLYTLLTDKEKQTVRINRYEKGSTIFHEDELCEYIGIILQGEINILSYSFSGKEIVYNFLKEDEVFGNNLIFSDQPHFRGNVISVSKSKIALIHKKDLLSILQHNESFLTEYLRIQSNFGKELNARIKLISLENAEDRLMYYLYLNKGKITYKSITSLATSLSLARETLSRLITKLISENKIKRQGKTIELRK